MYPLSLAARKNACKVEWWLSVNRDDLLLISTLQPEIRKCSLEKLVNSSKGSVEPGYYALNPKADGKGRQPVSPALAPATARALQLRTQRACPRLGGAYLQIAPLAQYHATNLEEAHVAAGEKGMRYALPNARILLHQPSGSRSGYAPHVLPARPSLASVSVHPRRFCYLEAHRHTTRLMQKRLASRSRRFSLRQRTGKRRRSRRRRPAISAQPTPP